MKILYLVSAGGAAMRRSVRVAIETAANDHELRMLAPDAEAKALRPCAVPTESWRPAGLFNVLRAINVLRRAVDRFDPDVIHAFGWTAAAVALGALRARSASRTLVTLQDPIRKAEMPKTFVEKRLPELFVRSAGVQCAYETLRRVLCDTLNVPAEKVDVVPYGVEPLAVQPSAERAPRPGPIVGYAGRLESDRGWEIVIDALAIVRARFPEAQLRLGRTGPIAGLVRAHARAARVADAVTFEDDPPLGDFFAGIDLLLVPGGFDGLPYIVVEALVNGVPLVAGDTGGLSDTLAPYAGWLVPDDAAGFAAGVVEAWQEIESTRESAQAQRLRAVRDFSAGTRRSELLAAYERAAGSPEPARERA